MFDLFFNTFLLTVTYILVPLSLFVFLSKLRVFSSISAKLLLFTAMALGPFLVTLLLYYQFLFVPHHADYFYVLTTCLITLLPLSGLSRKLCSDIVRPLREYFFFIKKESPVHKEHTLQLIYAGNTRFVDTKKILVLFTLFFFIFNIFYCMQNSLTGHDMLEYSLYGDNLYSKKKIEYVKDIYDRKSGFYYVGLHGPSLPLFKTWERLANNLVFKGYATDFLFRSISVYYRIILFYLGLLLILPSGLWASMFWFILYNLPIGFFNFSTFPHIDSFRICLICLTLYYFYHLLHLRSNSYFVLFAICCGAQSFVHSLGVFIAVIMGVILFLFYPDKILQRLGKTLALLAIVLIFGNIHYVLDALTGTGWIFRNIKFY
jgi:hypothetical protein